MMRCATSLAVHEKGGSYVDFIKSGWEQIVAMTKDQAQIIGVWKLESWIHEDVETHERRAVFGENPNGCLVLTSSGRLVALLTGAGHVDAWLIRGERMTEVHPALIEAIATFPVTFGKVPPIEDVFRLAEKLRAKSISQTV
jgi:Lipocalin-like domain